MTALSQDRASELEVAQLRADVHRLRGVVEACDVRHRDDEAETQRLRTEIRRLSHGHRIFALQVRCDSAGCSSVVAFDPAPADEAALAQALVALRWSLEDGHRCPRCSRGR